METSHLSQGVAREGWAVSDVARLTARKLFFDDKWTREAIAAHLSCSYNSVRTFLKEGPLSKKERKALEKSPPSDPGRGTDTEANASTREDTPGEAA